MNTMTDYMRKTALDASMGLSPTLPTKVFVAAFTTATTDAGGGTEVKGGGYARTAVPFTASSAAAGTGTIKSSAEVDFPVATGVWGKVTHLALFDAATGGNMLYHGAVPVAKQIEVGDRLRILKGDVEATIK